FRIAAATNATVRPTIATTPPTSKSLTVSGPRAAHGEIAALIAPAAITIRSSVGPKPKNDTRKTPAAWVARYDSAETIRNRHSTAKPTRGFIRPEHAMPAIKNVVPAMSMTWST